MSRVVSTLYKGVVSENGGKKWRSRISIKTSGTPALVKAEFSNWVECGTHPSEGAAAHAHDV